MSILDRYILRQFLTNFVILLFVFSLLFVVGDVMIDLDEFVEAGRNRVQTFGGNVAIETVKVIIDFDGPMVLLLYAFFSGLIVVGAAGFTYAGLARTSELIAMIASGISMYRVAMAVLLAGGLLNIVAIVNQELFIPRLAYKLSRGKGELKYEHIRQEPIYFALDGNGSLLSAGDFSIRGEQARLSDVTILKRDASGRAVARVTAGQAVWDQVRGGWELAQGYAIRRTAEGADSETPAATGAAMIEEDFFATDLSPTVLLTRRTALYLRLLSMRQLQAMMDHPMVDRDEVRRIMHSRLSLLVLNIVVLAMGLPFFLVREPANFLVQSMKAAGVCIGAWSCGLVMQQMGSTQLNPVAAAWLPVVIYLPISAVLMQTVRT